MTKNKSIKRLKEINDRLREIISELIKIGDDYKKKKIIKTLSVLKKEKVKNH